MLKVNTKFTPIISWRYINTNSFGYRNFIYLNFRREYLFSTMSSKGQPEWHVPENKETLPTLKLYNSLTRSKVTWTYNLKVNLMFNLLTI